MSLEIFLSSKYFIALIPSFESRFALKYLLTVSFISYSFSYFVFILRVVLTLSGIPALSASILSASVNVIPLYF